MMPDWIPVVSERGWIVITVDKHIWTRLVGMQMAIDHHLEAVHLEISVGHVVVWQQLVCLAKCWEVIENQVTGSSVGSWWFSVRSS
ncbi:hypothetical protein MUBE_14355 [Mycobacterium uberis]|uniref:VapC45 PIN like domain-containing protein n=2 Tax=Mycobacterium uberis TaxID=2162698 RepID=A0A3E1HCD6_9MYCO|nr:hypothetical protein MUBE_14355 [Mycobacterium uberis]